MDSWFELAPCLYVKPTGSGGVVVISAAGPDSYQVRRFTMEDGSQSIELLGYATNPVIGAGMAENGVGV